MPNDGDGPNPNNTPSAEALERFSAYIELQKEQLKLRRQEAQILEEQTEELKIQAELEKANLAKKAQALDAELSKINEMLASTEQLSDAERQRLEGRKTLLSIDITQNARKRARINEDLKNQKELDRFATGIAGKLGMQAKFADTKLGKFKLLVENTKNMSNGQEYINKLMADFLSDANLAAAALSFMYESVLAVALSLESANAQFQRTTGFAGDFKGQLTDIAVAGVASGVTTEDAAKAMGSLVKNFSAFNPAAEETNIQLSESITLLEKTGVSADTSAKTMNFFNKVMGESPQAAAKLTEELALAGTGIGITTSKMLSDFESVNGYLIGFGDRTTEVFLELQAQAKATGVEIGALVNIAKKFDTFKGAAEVAGSLNAALGTQIGQLDMINASSEQRIALLAQEIDFATGGFENLDRYTQLYVAEAIGAKDAAEAQKLLSLQRNPAELAKYNAKMQEQQARQQDLNELTEQFVPVLEQFKIAALGLGLALSPLLKLLGFVFDVISQMINNLVSLVTLNEATIVGFTLLAAALAAVMLHAPIVGLFSMIAAGITAVGAASKLAAAGGLLGLLLMFISMAQVLGTQINPVFVAAFAFMAVGIRAMAMAMNAAQPQALIFAIAVGIIAASVALLVYAMAELITSVTGLFSLLLENLSTLPELVTGLYALGTAFAFFGLGLAAASFGMSDFLPTFILMAILLSPIIERVEALGQAFSLVGAGMQSIVDGLNVIKNFKDDDEFFAISTDGAKTSMVSAKGGTLAGFSGDTLTVDVKVPEIKIPEIKAQIVVNIGNDELRNYIEDIVKNGGI